MSSCFRRLTYRLIHLVSYLSLCLATLPVISASAQATLPKYPSSEVHILVQVLSANGDPVGDLAAKDFHVKAGNVSVPFEVERPAKKAASIPTRLLVVLAASAHPSPNPALLVDQIKPLWKETWQVSILNAAGVQTPYASNDQELRKAINQGPFKQTTVASAARNLSRFVGRRVIFLITDPGVPTDSKVLMAAQRAGAMLYHVGGDPWKNKRLAYGETGSLGAHATETIAAAGGEQDAPYFYNYRIYGRPIEERNFSGARKDSVHDGIGYYVLRLNGPPSASSLSLSIDIIDPFSDNARYQVHALPYAEGTTPPSVAVVSGR